MSIIMLKDINLVFQIRQPFKLKDLFNSKRTSELSKFSDGRIHALKNIDLQLNDGDRLGIIGHNGAGKSTLLKLLAGIYPPTSGQLVTEGRIATLFELATGFEMEATGWENIYLRGLMLGETPKSIKEKTIEIAEFSELGDYLDIPVKFYSSGMFVRLAFSISTAIEPDILLLDEVVAAGDVRFLEKAEKRLKNLLKNVKIVVFVSHSMDSITNICNKCIWINQGELRLFGETKEVIEKYLEAMRS